MTPTERLRELLDERGVEHYDRDGHTLWEPINDGWYRYHATESADGTVNLHMHVLTPAQAVEATLGREPWVNPVWERWHRSLRHDEIKSVGDAVEQLMYEAIEFGGDMGPNGNTYNGIDEGDVLTAGFINEWVARFEVALGLKRDERLAARMTEVMMRVERALGVDHGGAEVLSAEVAPLLREALAIIDDAVAFGRGECGYDETDTYAAPDVHALECTECGGTYEHVNGAYEFCPRCGRKVRGDA